MNFCPNCNNEICANGFITHMVNVIDLMTDQNQLKMQLVDKHFLENGYFGNDEYLDKLRKPRVIPTVIPKMLPDISDFDFFTPSSFQSITVTCKNTFWIFQYTELSEIEVLDN